MILKAPLMLGLEATIVAFEDRDLRGVFMYEHMVSNVVCVFALIAA